MPPTKSPTPSPTAQSSKRASPLRLQMNSSLPPFTVPAGWTTELSRPEIRCEWEGNESLGQTIARCYGLGPATPVMEDNTTFTIFQSNDKFYLLERIENGVHEFACRDIREIALKIPESEFRGLRLDSDVLPGAILP